MISNWKYQALELETRYCELDNGQDSLHWDRAEHKIFYRSGSVQKPINIRKLVNLLISNFVYPLSSGKKAGIKSKKSM